jgi:hydrogenase-4 component E
MSADAQLLDLAAGLFLLAAVAILWRRDVRAQTAWLGVQGAALAALAALAAILGADEAHPELYAVAAGVGLLRAVVLPALVRRALAARAQDRESAPLINVGASLLAAAALVLMAYAVAQPLVRLEATAAARALPVGLAVVLIGLLVLVTRRKALSQIVGFLLLDNGITAIAFLAAAGVPLLVEFGVSFDLLLAVLVLRVLTARMRAVFGGSDLDEMRELHD